MRLNKIWLALLMAFVLAAPMSPAFAVVRDGDTDAPVKSKKKKKKVVEDAAAGKSSGVGQGGNCPSNVSSTAENPKDVETGLTSMDPNKPAPSKGGKGQKAE